MFAECKRREIVVEQGRPVCSLKRIGLRNEQESLIERAGKIESQIRYGVLSASDRMNMRYECELVVSGAMHLPIHNVSEELLFF